MYPESFIFLSQRRTMRKSAGVRRGCFATASLQVCRVVMFFFFFFNEGTVWRRKVHEMFHPLLVCAQTGVVGTEGKNNWSWTVVADCIDKEAPEQRQDCSRNFSSVSQIKLFKTHCVSWESWVCIRVHTGQETSLRAPRNTEERVCQ